MEKDLNDKILLGDCIDLFKDINNCSVDGIVSSPPYKSEDGFSFNLMKSVAEESFRVLKDNSLCCINFGHLAEDKLRPFKVALLFEKAGFNPVDTITWEKNHFTPLRGNKRVNNLTEFIFIFSKGKKYSLDRLSIGVPYKDPSNAKRWKSSKGNNLRCRGNCWYIPYETINSKSQKLHKDRFPVALPEMCLKLSGLKRGLVLDPFCGSATTCLAAKSLGLNYLGFEKIERNYNISIDRLKNIR